MRASWTWWRPRLVKPGSEIAAGVAAGGAYPALRGPRGCSRGRACPALDRTWRAVVARVPVWNGLCTPLRTALSGLLGACGERGRLRRRLLLPERLGPGRAAVAA